IWAAALLGIIAGTPDWKRWHLRPALRIPLAMWALAIAATWPIVVLREFDFTTMTAGAWRTSNTHIGVPPSLAAMGVANAAANQLVALLCIDWLFGRYSDEPGEAYARDVVYWLGLGCLVSVAVAFDQAVVDIGFLNTGIFAGTG